MEKTKRYFRDADETWAGFYEKDPKRHEKCLKYSMKMLNPKGKRCLDLGCGWGRFLRSFLNNGAERVVGVDINLRNLERCKEIGAELVRGDIENLPLANNSFNICSIIGTMEHLPYPDKVIDEIRRVLKIYGLACITWNHYFWIKALWDPVTRMRLRLYLRDILGMIFPSLRMPRVYRNSGFSLRAIRQSHRRRGLTILNLVRFPRFVLTIGRKEK